MKTKNLKKRNLKWRNMKSKCLDFYSYLIDFQFSVYSRNLQILLIKIISENLILIENKTLEIKRVNWWYCKKNKKIR